MNSDYTSLWELAKTRARKGNILPYRAAKGAGYLAAQNSEIFSDQQFCHPAFGIEHLPSGLMTQHLQLITFKLESHKAQFLGRSLSTQAT